MSSHYTPIYVNKQTGEVIDLSPIEFPPGVATYWQRGKPELYTSWEVLRITRNLPNSKTGEQFFFAEKITWNTEPAETPYEHTKELITWKAQVISEIDFGVIAKNCKQTDKVDFDKLFAHFFKNLFISSPNYLLSEDRTEKAKL